MHDFAAAQFYEVPFATHKSTRSGSLFLSDSQYVGSPIDKCYNSFLSEMNKELS
jgi:hypothetical protein